MSIYFDFKTINELTGDNYYRQPKEFTLEELARYNGNNGNPAYVAIEGIVYDITRQGSWNGGEHFGLAAGQDLTEQFNSCHGMIDILTNAPKVGVLADDNMSDRFNSHSYMIRQTGQQDTSKFTPDDWVRYITPIVTYGLREPNQGMNPQRIYQRVAILGVLVGLGKTPQEAISQLQDWQSTGASKLLKGGTGTSGGFGSGGMGTSGTGTGAGTGTGGGFGTSGTGTGAGTGTGGGFGTSGTGTGAGTGTGGGFGTSGTGTGAGTGTGGGFGTSGTGTGAGTGTGGGFGTSGTGTGAGTGTGGGFGTSGTGTGAGTGTGGGFGTSGTGTGTGTGTGGGFGTSGTGTSAGTGTSGGMGTSGMRDRLYFD